MCQEAVPDAKVVRSFCALADDPILAGAEAKATRALVKENLRFEI